MIYEFMGEIVTEEVLEERISEEVERAGAISINVMKI